MHARAELRPLVRITRTQLANRIAGARGVRTQCKLRVFRPHHRPRVPSMNLQTIACKIEIANDLGRHCQWLERVVSRQWTLAHERDLLSRAGEIVRRHQFVYPVANDNHADRHRDSLNIVSAAFRPDAPMTPPPGCVPEPHW